MGSNLVDSANPKVGGFQTYVYLGDVFLAISYLFHNCLTQVTDFCWIQNQLTSCQCYFYIQNCHMVRIFIMLLTIFFHREACFTDGTIGTGLLDQ